jgi:hypothetical protein
MSNHDLTFNHINGAWHCSCLCTNHSGPCVEKWQAEDWGTTHLREVERVRAHLRSRTPSLLDQARWYREQAATASNPKDRNLWVMLATGIENRLGHKVDEQPLFEENA